MQVTGGGKKVCRYRATVVLYSALPATRGQTTSRENKRSRSRRNITDSYPNSSLDLTKVVFQPPTIERHGELRYRTRGVLADRRFVGPSARVSRMEPRRLLRLVRVTTAAQRPDPSL